VEKRGGQEATPLSGVVLAEGEALEPALFPAWSQRRRRRLLPVRA
jgi:hypothetical protein